MKKSSYHKLRERLDKIDFISKYFIKKCKEQLTGDYEKDRYNAGIIAAMETIQEEINEHEKSDDSATR